MFGLSNFINRTSSSILRNFYGVSQWANPVASSFLGQITQKCALSLNQLSKRPLIPPKYEKHKKFSVMKGRPQIRGIILKLMIKKPKKPNSANRKVAYVRLSDGRHVYAYIPGIGHSLQEHNVVLVQGGGPQDVPYVYCSVIRGRLDCALPVHKMKKKK